MLLPVVFIDTGILSVNKAKNNKSNNAVKRKMYYN